MSEDAGEAAARAARRVVILSTPPRLRRGGRQPVLRQTLAVIYARALRAPIVPFPPL